MMALSDHQFCGDDAHGYKYKHTHTHTLKRDLTNSHTHTHTDVDTHTHGGPGAFPHAARMLQSCSGAKERKSNE